MNEPVNLTEKLASFEEAVQPRIIGYYNDNKLQLAKSRGEFVLGDSAQAATPETEI